MTPEDAELAQLKLLQLWLARKRPRAATDRRQPAHWSGFVHALVLGTVGAASTDGARLCRTNPDQDRHLNQSHAHTS